MEERRNEFYQKDFAEQLRQAMAELQTQLNNALTIHLNVNQSYLINSSALLHSFQKLSFDSLRNQSFADDRIHFPSTLNNVTQPPLQSLRVRLRRSGIEMKQKRRVSVLVRHGTFAGVRQQ